MTHRLTFIALAAIIGVLDVAAAGIRTPIERRDIAAAQNATSPTLEDLRGVDELKALFNNDVGKVRLVLLLSPT